jgi:riboflavin kinase/FMN adenylyltransferase
MTIGNFDGLHRGHQAVLAELRDAAQARGLQLLLMTFEPTPKEMFAPDQAPARLATLREKAELAARHGVDRMLCARFDKRFAAQSPEEFVENVVVRCLAAEVVMVGADFRFGAKRAGDFALLEQMGRDGVQGQTFEARVMPTVELSGERVSSTAVRQALADGQPGRAAELLGRSYCMSGRVAGGQRLGRTLGVPTANLIIRRKPAPCFGVYAVLAELEDGRQLPAAASLGVRPTVNGQGCVLEVHLLDFSETLYGQHMKVHFQHFLRPEKRFDDVPALRDAMMQDIAEVRRLLAADAIQTAGSQP